MAPVAALVVEAVELMKTDAEAIADLRKKLRKARADLKASEARNSAIEVSS